MPRSAGDDAADAVAAAAAAAAAVTAAATVAAIAIAAAAVAASAAAAAVAVAVAEAVLHGRDSSGILFHDGQPRKERDQGVGGISGCMFPGRGFKKLIEKYVM
mmetsp:Transcript_35280/g.76566  ORF Transcript_35280/g.76566 Transcript_35280/m.76566 type:complete len:103 (-) Transcript_35280:289-597(-)